MANLPMDRIVSEYEARQTETLARLPPEVRAVIQGIVNSDVQEQILELLGNFHQEVERTLMHGQVMFFLGHLSCSQRLGQLTRAQHDALSDYISRRAAEPA